MKAAYLFTMLVFFGFSAMAQQGAGDFQPMHKEHKSTPAEIIEQFSAPPVEAYALDDGDEITIDVWGRPELSTHQTIGPDGKITLPLTGPFKIAGLTREEAQKAITATYQPYYSNLAVTVRVDHYNSFRVYVLGRVGVPGALLFDKQPTLLDVLTRAASLPIGGVGAEKAGLVRCAVFRGRDKLIWIDLKPLLSEGNLALNIRLGRDDVVYLPDADDQLVYVLGFVKSPGAFRLTPSMSFMDALSLAGGPTQDAAQSKIELVRITNGKQQRIPFKDVLDHKIPNFTLEEGDIIYVPPRKWASFGYVVEKIAPLATFSIFATVATQ
jgi:polysaccharide export outer membrane protein